MSVLVKQDAEIADPWKTPSSLENNLQIFCIKTKKIHDYYQYQAYHKSHIYNKL